AKTTASAPAAALASVTACRKLPGPESFVLVTVKVAAAAGPAPASTAPTARPRATARLRLRSARRSRSASTRRSRREWGIPTPPTASPLAMVPSSTLLDREHLELDRHRVPLHRTDVEDPADHPRKAGSALIEVGRRDEGGIPRLDRRRVRPRLVGQGRAAVVLERPELQVRPE